MPDTDEKFYQVQEGFRITYEGERTGLYKLSPLANGETEELWIGEPLWIGGIVEDERGGKQEGKKRNQTGFLLKMAALFHKNASGIEE